MKYTYYTEHGEILDIVSEKPLVLGTLQTLVGGNIEGLALNDGTYIFFNEEGLLDNLQINPSWPEEHPLIKNVMTGGGLRGNVIRGKIDDDGEFQGEK